MLGARSPSTIVTAQSGKDTECSTDGTGLGAYRQCGTGAWGGLMAGEANGGDGGPLFVVGSIVSLMQGR